MAERTLAELEASASRPSMVPASEEEAYARFIDVRGPYKVETIYYQQEASNDFKAEDTTTSWLAHPLFATIAPCSDLAGTALIGSVDLVSDESNANFKQLKIYDCEGLNSLGIVITVYGF